MKKKEKPTDLLSGKEKAKEELAGIASQVDALASPEGEGNWEKVEGEPLQPEGELPKGEPKKKRGRKKKEKPSPIMIEAIKPLIAYPVDTLLRFSFGPDTLSLSEEEKAQLANATDALFNKWFPVLIEKWSEEFAFGIVLLSIFSKRLIVKQYTKKPKEEEKVKSGK